MKKIKILTTIILSSILFLGILFFINPKFWLTKLFPVKVEIQAANTKISEESIDVDLVLILKDSKIIKYLSDSVDYNVILDGDAIVSGSVNVNKEILHGDVDTVMVPISLSRSMLKSKTTKFNKGDSTNLKLQLMNHVEFPIIGSFDIPIEKEIRIAAPQPPEVTITNVNKIKLGLKDAIYELEVDIYNPNYVEISILSADVYIDIKDLFKGNARSPKAIKIKPQGRSKITARIDLDEFNLINDGLKVLFKPQKEWNYYAVAKVLIEQEDGEPVELIIKNSGKTKLLGLK